MKQLTVLVDMDDTIERLSEAWVRCLNKRYGLNRSHLEIRNWNMASAFPELEPDQVYAPLEEDWFWETVKPSAEAEVFLNKLIQDGHSVYVVTTSNYHTLASKMRNVLFRYFPMIDWEHVIVTSNKQMVRGDVMIDDAPHNLIGGDYVRILIDAPHNRSFKESKYGVFRVHNLTDAYGIINCFAN